jgi:hypothetical protein
MPRRNLSVSARSASASCELCSTSCARCAFCCCNSPVCGTINVQTGGLLTVRSGIGQIATIDNDGTVSTGGGGNKLLIDGPVTGSGTFDIAAGGDELQLGPQSSVAGSVNVDFLGGPAGQ